MWGSNIICEILFSLCKSNREDYTTQPNLSIVLSILVYLLLSQISYFGHCQSFFTKIKTYNVSLFLYWDFVLGILWGYTLDFLMIFWLVWVGGKILTWLQFFNSIDSQFHISFSLCWIQWSVSLQWMWTLCLETDQIIKISLRLWQIWL